MSESKTTVNRGKAAWAFYVVSAGMFGGALLGVFKLGWPLAVTCAGLAVAVSLWGTWFWPGKGERTGGTFHGEDDMDVLSDRSAEPDLNINGMPMTDGLDCLGNTYGSDFHPDK